MKFIQYIKNNVLYLSEKTSFKLDDNFLKIKFKYLKYLYWDNF